MKLLVYVFIEICFRDIIGQHTVPLNKELSLSFVGY